MPRDIPVGNGRLLICFDRHYAIRDIYFPHVGQENHVGGNFCRMGVYAEDRFSWIGEEWKRELSYDEQTLVARATLYHPELKLILVCRDAVDFHEDVYLKEIEVENLLARKRRVEVFLCHDFDISGNSIGDTAAFDPSSGGIVHYKASRYFLVNGRSDEIPGLAQFAVGVKKTGGKEGTFRDAEDGRLSGNPVAQGSVDSVVSLRFEPDAHSTQKGCYWICAGKDWKEARRIDALVKRKTPQAMVARTADYWNLWVKKESPPIEKLPPKVGELYRRSLLVLATQLDSQGGIVAANDSDVIQYNRDTYSYVWPRDGALAANALDLAGYPEPARRFYAFLSGLLEEGGYFLHKYNPDGTLASSWHPWYEDSEQQLPIQEDETALVVWALWQHFVLYRDIEFIKPFYGPFIKKAADFMVSYRDEATGLPGPSYDLWEERRGILSFTTGAVFGGLAGASLFCTVFGEEDKAETYRKAASEIRDGASKHLWQENAGRFSRMIARRKDGSRKVDMTCDSSLWGLFAFGLYTPRDPRIKATQQALKEALSLQTATGGLARYENDGYYRISPDVPGNPWFISSLWYADYLIRKAEQEDELREAEAILAWAADHALPSGVLAEQLHPFSGDPLSVSPLAWSHATFVSVAQHYMRRLTGKAPGFPLLDRREDWIGHLFSETCDAIHAACRIS